jgi:ElaB/YqjD/DUF883 family membrane-anchored ribosome-binding protein
MKNPSNMNESVTPGNGAATSHSTNSEFRNFIADVEDLVKATTSLTGEELTEAKAALSARVVAARQSAEAMGGAIADQARNTAKATNSFVHAHPWQSAGIGAALGLLLGVVFARTK